MLFYILILLYYWKRGVPLLLNPISRSGNENRKWERCVKWCHSVPFVSGRRHISELCVWMWYVMYGLCEVLYACVVIVLCVVIVSYGIVVWLSWYYIFIFDQKVGKDPPSSSWITSPKICSVCLLGRKISNSKKYQQVQSDSMFLATCIIYSELIHKF